MSLTQNYKKYLADLMHDFIRSPDAMASVFGTSSCWEAMAMLVRPTRSRKEGASSAVFVASVHHAFYLWPHIMCYCPNFLERDNKTLVDNAEECTTSSLGNTAHSLRFHSQNGTCDIIPRDNPEMLLKAPAPLHDNIHMAVLFVTLLVVAIHRHHPELHQKPQFDAWLQRNNITNEVRKVMPEGGWQMPSDGHCPCKFRLHQAAAAAAASVVVDSLMCILVLLLLLPLFSCISCLCSSCCYVIITVLVHLLSSCCSCCSCRSC